MSDFMIETVSDPVTETRRYVANAKNLLEDKSQLDYVLLANDIIDRCAKML